MNQTFTENYFCSGENFIEDFFVIGPDVSHFKKLKEDSGAKAD